jgi:hypothetical protein
LADIPLDQLQAYGVRLISPGTYRDACTKGYFKCAKGQSSAHVAFDSVELFKYEGVSSIFYWDGAEDKFKRLWVAE